MNDKSTCFISYCHDDVNREEIDFIVETLKKNTKKTTDYLYDNAVGIGRRFRSFMQLLDVVDLVLMVCSPKYKLKAEMGPETGGGVGFEYDLINKRYNQILKEKKETLNEYLSERSTNPFEVLPIVLKGNYDISIPNEFQDNKAINLSYFKITNKQTKTSEVIKIIPSNIKIQFENDITRIIDTLKANHRQKQKSYEEELSKTYDYLKLDSLFRDTKADFNNSKYSLEEYEDTLFVRTHVYKQIENQSAYILIGRKGSGKSAITQVLPIRSQRYNSPYFGVVDIYANRDINFNVLYSFLNHEFVSDTRHIFDRLKCFKFGWALFFRICLMDLIVKKSNEPDFPESSKKRISKISTYIADLNKLKTITPNESKTNYFTFSFNSIQRFMNNCIAKARKDETYFITDIDAQFNLTEYINFTIGNDRNQELEEYLENMPHKFLITFDGFDTEIEKFREEGQFFADDNLEEKVRFEIDWLHSLLLLVNDIKQFSTGKELLDDKLDFCLTIPNHRYLEILRKDIDSYRFQHRRKYLIWTGIELLIFLRKRLEILSGFRTTKKTPWESYEELIKEKFSYIPEKIEFYFNDKLIKIDLFLYVLRHTFWRPRDILLYYAHIITLCKDCKDNGHVVSYEAIRTNIANLTFEIIKDDFKSEFKGTVRNLEEIMERFAKAKQVLNFDEIEEHIHDIDFEFVIVANEDMRSNILEKIKFLYQIGFLGIRASNELKEKFNLFSNHIFMFNEGAKLFKKVSKEKLREYQFVIHPIFSEYLELNTKNNEFISEYYKEYIINLEGFMKASNEDFEIE